MADTDNHSIRNSIRTERLSGAGVERGQRRGSYYYPRGLTTNSDGQVYVADTGNNRVQRLDVDRQSDETLGQIRVCLAQGRYE